MNAQALIFDFDGTLFQLPVDWAGLRAEIGLPQDGSITEWMQRCLDSGETDGLAVATKYELAAVPHGRFAEGAEALLMRVPEQYPTAVLTRNSAECVRAALGRFADSLVIVGREHVRRLKPDPEGVHAILAAFGVGQQGCLLVGDIFHDVLAARAAGVRSAVVPNPALRYQPEGADIYLDSLLTAPF